MKNAFVVLAILIVGALFAAGFVAAAGGPAIVIKNDGLCGMPGSDADGNLIFGGIGQIATTVENGNKVTIKCKGDGITNDSGRGQNFNGFTCGIQPPTGGFVITSDSHATISASHVGTLTCTYTK